MNQLNEDELSDLQITIQELIDNYIETNILHMSNPFFNENMISSISEILFTDLITANIISSTDEMEEDNNFIQLTEFVEEMVETHFLYYRIPKRSNSITTDNDLVYETEISLKQKIETLQNEEQPPQKTKEWYLYRYNLITASNLWKVFGTASQKNSLIYEKCKPFIFNNYEYSNQSGPMFWGIKYEPVTIMIYENMFETKIGDFGCLKHPKHSFIGASPDGINIKPNNIRYGRMLEIKNVFNRDITGIPKQEYWIQTQLQMEVCNLNSCDFVETRIKEYESKEDFLLDNEHEYKGIILNFLPKFKPCDLSQNEEVLVNNKIELVYMPLDIKPYDIDLWIEEEKHKHENMCIVGTQYWYLDEISCVLIQRNMQWFEAALPEIQSLWCIVETERIEGYEHRASKKRVSSVDDTISANISVSLDDFDN